MMSKLKVSLLSGAAAAATLALGAGSASATNGMMPHCVGTYKCGMGGAGVAYATDASNAAINPALGGRLGNEAIVNLGWFHATVSGEVRNDRAGNNSIARANMGAQKSSAKDFADGSVGINFVVDDKTTFNVTMFPGGGGASNWQYGRTFDRVPGMALSDGGDSKVRYRMFYLQPSIAYKASESSTYGFGVILSRSDIKSDSLGRAFTQVTPNKKETANGIGFQFGGVWDMSDTATFGMNYRTKVWHQSFNTNYSTMFRSAVNSPDQLTMGIAVDNAFETEGLTAALDGKWIHWGGVDTVGGNEPETGAFGWQDQFVLMAGLEYDLDDSTAVRVGYNYGESPIDEGHIFANFLFPAVVEHHFTAGASVALTDDMEFGMSGYWSPATKITNNDGGQAGTYSWMGSGSWMKMAQYGGQLSVKVGF